MNILQPHLRSCVWKLVVLIAVICMPAFSFATSSLFEARVLDRDGQPCFAVEKSHLKNSLQLFAINVFAESEPKVSMWRQFVDVEVTPPFIFAGDECVPYGTQIANAEVLISARQLTPGRHYVVALSAVSRRGASLENKQYRAYFCVSNSPDGIERVHQIFFDNMTGRRNWSICD